MPATAPTTALQPASPDSAQHQLVLLLYPGVMSLDITGPMQVFATANDERGRHGLPPHYQLVFAAEAAGLVRSTAGLQLHADTAWDDVALHPATTVLIPGGDGADAAAAHPGLRRWLQQAAPQVQRMGSVCSGALVLAQAGLLDGVHATTHWLRLQQLQRNCPDSHVDGNCLHTYDARHPVQSRRFTSAGVTAGIDLALALVEADLGRPLALAVARHLVMFMRRPGGQAQFSPLLSPETTQAPRLTQLLEWIPSQLHQDLSVERLAAQACLPPRTLARVFQRELGTTPARYVERVRLNAASQLLSQRQASVSTVARLCGFGHAETLRRSFQRHLAISPQAFAQRFGAG